MEYLNIAFLALAFCGTMMLALGILLDPKGYFELIDGIRRPEKRAAALFAILLPFAGISSGLWIWNQLVPYFV